MKNNMRLLSRVLSVGLSLALCAGMVAPAFAASFSDLQNAINGNEGGTQIENSDRYGYGWNQDENRYGIEAWDTEDGRNVQLNEDVRYENGEDKDGIIIGEDQKVDLNLNGNDINGTAEGAETPSVNQVITVEDGGSLTLDDSTADVTENGTYESGKITGGKTGVVNRGEFTMNDGAISGNVESAGLGGGVYNEGTFEMNGGSIDNNKTGNGGGVFNTDKGTFTMNGGQITDNKANGGKTSWGTVRDGDGGGVYNNGGTFTMNGGTIDKNTAVSNGGGVYANGGKLTMEGGSIDHNTASKNGGGVYVDNGTFDMKGGVIDGNKTNVDFTHADYDGTDAPTQGGGVYVIGGNAGFNLSGGTISNNQAGEGGGVFIDHTWKDGAAQFNMTGGEVSGNTAKFGEGGGIYISGKGEISGGKILNNRTETTHDLGGGGIYIEADGTLKLYNAIITENTANGLGGGLAACVHGKTIVYYLDGAAIYGNSAKGETTTGNGHNGNGEFMDGHNLWKNDEEFKKGAQDIFAASDATEKNGSGTPGILVSNTMLGGGTANLEGIAFLFRYNPDGTLVTDKNGNYVYEIVKVDGDGIADRLLGVSTKPTEEDIAAAKEAAAKAANGGVLISGNHSNTHGGGIGNNGTLTIGKPDGDKGFQSNATSDGVEMNKNLMDGEGNQKPLDKVEFEFTMKDENGGSANVTVKNDANGGAVFEFPKGYFKKAGQYTFTVSEKDLGNVLTPEMLGLPEDAEIEVNYDKSEYKITINVSEKKYNITVGKIETEVTDLRVDDLKIELVKNEKGEAVESTKKDGIEFNNSYTYTTPEPTPTPSNTPEPTPTPSNTPEPTPTPSNTPEPTPTPSNTPEPTPTPSNTPEPTPTPSNTPEPTPTPSNTPEPTPTPSNTPEVPVTPEPTPESTPPVEYPVNEFPEEPELDEPEIPLDEEPVEELEEPEIPLDELPEEEELDEPDIPLSDVPQTGDISLAWYAALIMSVCGLAVLAVSKKREGTEG